MIEDRLTKKVRKLFEEGYDPIYLPAEDIQLAREILQRRYKRLGRAPRPLSQLLFRGIRILPK